MLRLEKRWFIPPFLIRKLVNIWHTSTIMQKQKNLIKEGHLMKFEIVDSWNNISPALVLYFDNNKPMPIREHRFDEYFEILKQKEGD